MRPFTAVLRYKVATSVTFKCFELAQLNLRIQLLSLRHNEHKKILLCGSKAGHIKHKNALNSFIYNFSLLVKGFWGFGEIGRASCRERVSSPV